MAGAVGHSGRSAGVARTTGTNALQRRRCNQADSRTFWRRNGAHSFLPFDAAKAQFSGVRRTHQPLGFGIHQRIEYFAAEIRRHGVAGDPRPRRDRRGGYAPVVFRSRPHRGFQGTVRGLPAAAATQGGAGYRAPIALVCSGPGELLNLPATDKCLRAIALFLLSTQATLAQESHPKPPPPPPGAKAVKCVGREVPQFTDITSKTGIHFDHVSSSDSKYVVESMSGGVLLIDYDRDGYPDIYFTNAPTVDMAMKGQAARGALYHNNHDGTFTDVTEKAGLATPCFAMGGAVGDYNNDGWPDIYLTCLGGNKLFKNNGDGTFTDVSKAAGVDDPDGYYGMSVIFCDFNNTGRPDIYVANDSTPKFLYKNLGNGKFQEIGLESGTAVSEDGSEQASMGIAVGDYLHTGLQSLYVTNFSDEYSNLFRNDGEWNFSDVSYKSGVALPSLPYVKWGTAFFDADNDGWLDLIVVGGHVYPQVDTLPSGARYKEPKVLQLNQKDGTFCDASDQAGPDLRIPRVSRGVAAGDLFNDGNMDLVIEDLAGSPMILRNNGIAGRHWVSFELQGTKSNRMAIGARLKIVAGGLTQTEEIHSGGSYLSQNDLRVHFGLNTAKKIDSLEIRWPSGKIETLKNLDVDKFYSVLEGQGIVPAEKIRAAPALAAKP